MDTRLFRAPHVVQVGSAEVCAHETVARGVDRPVVIAKLDLVDLERTTPREQLPVAPHTSRP